MGRGENTRFQGKTRFKALYLLTAFILLHQPPLLCAEEVDLTGLSVEELMDLKVTSVGKKVQNLSDSAAAIYVITNDDIRKSGVTNIPDALRMAPGINVARIDSNKWAVNSRSANSRFADKLLVMIDGRSVYTPTFSGVYWEVQDVMLEDIDRIEVIRGPGATLWGANAVNGVINIITKHASDTLGGLVSAGGGTQEQGFAGARYGAALSESTYGRFYAKGFKRGEFEYDTGGDANDDWGMVRSGFRVDSSISAKDSLSVHGDIYKGDIDQQMDLATPVWSVTEGFSRFIKDETETSGGNVVALWEHVQSAASKFTLQAYYDRTERDEAFVKEKRDNIDVDFQHILKAGNRNEIVWGARYRFSEDDFENTGLVTTLNPASSQDQLYSVFLQDEIMIARDLLWLTLGSKLEHNEYTGYEVQPSARLLWALRNNQKLWTSLSRAVRTPSRFEADGSVLTTVVPHPDSFNPLSPFYNPLNPLPIEIIAHGNKELDAEKLTAYELGYRVLFAHDFSLDAALFYHDYDKLRKFEEENIVFTGTGIVQNRLAYDTGTANSQGLELAAVWQATDMLKLDLAYSFLDSNMENEWKQLGQEPKHQVSLRGFVNLRDDLDLNIWLRYMDDVTAVYTPLLNEFYTVDEYVTLDLRLAWRPVPKMELSLVGQNLLDGGHMEFVQESFTRPTEVGRGVYGKFVYKF